VTVTLSVAVVVLGIEVLAGWLVIAAGTWTVR
jgi:hypothetical protein